MQKYTEQIGLLIAQRIPDFDFQKRDNRLYRATETGWQAIVLEVLPSATQGMGKLAAHAQVRHNDLEALYAPHHPYLKPNEANTHPTLVVNCDSLLKEKELVNAFSLAPASIIAVADGYAAAIKADVIPWLEKFSDEQQLFQGLKSNDLGNKITSHGTVRFPVLMAILAKRGDTTGFKNIDIEFQNWCKQKHSMVYAPLAAAMINMLPNPDSISQAPPS